MRKVSRSAVITSSRRLNLLLAAAAATALVPAAAHAQTAVSWIATTGNYNTGTNWSSGVTPSVAANEFLMINNGGTAQVTATSEGAFLNLGMQPGDTGNLSVLAGTLTLGELRVGGRETIPDVNNPGTNLPNGGGTGSVVQSGGTVSVTAGTEAPGFPIQSLYVGDAGLDSGNTANGSYSISNDAVLISGVAGDDAIVVGTGAGTNGTFSQQDNASVTSTGFVIVARRGATASYTMSGGTLQVGSPSLTPTTNMNFFIGEGANAAANDVVPGTVGSFTQSAGTVNVRNTMHVGRRGGTGTYTITGGQLNVAGEIQLATNAGSAANNLLSASGTMNIGGTAAVSIGTNLNVGISSSTLLNSATATLNQTGGTLSLNATGSIYAVGNGLGTSGTVNHSAGTLTLNNTSGVGLDIGRNNSSGTYNLSGTGVVNVGTITIESGVNAAFPNPSRIVNVSGGTLTATTVNFGSAASVGSTRQLNISNGNVTIGSLTAGSNGLTKITGGSVAINTQISLTSGSTIETSIPLTWPAAIALGNGTIQVDDSTLTLNGNVSSPTSGRTLTKTGPGTLALGGTWTYTTPATNNAQILTNAGTTVLNVDVNGPQSMTLTASANANINLNSSQNVKNVNTSGTVTLTPGGTKVLTVNNALSVTGGLLDLTNNSLVAATATNPVSTIRGYLASAFNNNTWTGTTGITSTTAAARADHATGLGYTDDGTNVTVLYTFNGDLNLDNKVDADDLALADRGLAQYNDGTIPVASAVWTQGDVNYDGAITSADFQIIDKSLFYYTGGAALSPSLLAQRESEFGATYVSGLLAAVPEPTSVALLAATSLLLTRRARRAQ